MPDTTETQDSQDASQDATQDAAHDEAETIRHVNTVDATVGQPMLARVTTRKEELEAALAALPEGEVRTRSDLELALTTINELLTGDLEHIPSVVVADMNRWLERNKHLAETATAP